jgi:uncharacterized protein (DUF1697 family)
MGRYVALLRGINVGAHNRVAMADLRELMVGLGYQDVRTHLQSGNVLFAAPGNPSNEDLQAAIADRLAAGLGLSAAVLVRTGEELRDVVAGNPLPAHDPARLMVLFLAAAIEPDRIDIDPGRYAPELFAVRVRADGRSASSRAGADWRSASSRAGEIYLYCANGILESGLIKVCTDRRLGCAVTARNWNTVTKLATLLDA